MLTRESVTAGKAIFTVNNASGEHYTYKVTKSEDGRCYFVSMLTGPDNTSDYTYIGLLTDSGMVKTTKASKMNGESRPMKVINWALQIIFGNKSLPDGYGINHVGKCLRCGRALTRPEGIDDNGYRQGFGPECYKLIKKGVE